MEDLWITMGVAGFLVVLIVLAIVSFGLFQKVSYWQDKYLKAQQDQINRPQTASAIDITYLERIMRRLKEVKQSASYRDDRYHLQYESLADDIDWLDCYIDKIMRR